ncbi:MAG TPA: hypothetical protein VFE65_34605 [Pseudonocardia sp.]|jgi:hypothetical protein|nr:hypothetical protein [Pseudonocardia sp.]
MGSESPCANGVTVTPARLRRAQFQDYPHISRLTSQYFHRQLPDTVWKRLYTDNPLWSRVGGRWPIGWVLENDDGEVVGSFLNIPSRYYLDGVELICASGSRWAVQPEYRGYASWLMDEHFNQPGVDLLINATASPTATPVLSNFAERVPVGDWANRAVRIIKYRNVASEVLEMKRLPGQRVAGPVLAGGLRVKDLALTPRLPELPRGVVGETLVQFDSRFDSFWTTLVQQNWHKLLAVRNQRTLEWHYGGPLRSGSLLICTASRNGVLLAYCVLKEHSFERLNLQSMQIIDYQTVADDLDLLPGLLRLALDHPRAAQVDIVESLCVGLPELRGFERAATLRYRRPSWSLYYQASGSDLQERLQSPEVWCPSGYDGDTSYF